jgi:trehalose 6-phosphate synthase/phosphatase
MIPTLPTTAASSSYDAMDTDDGTGQGPSRAITSSSTTAGSSTSPMNRPPLQSSMRQQHHHHSAASSSSSGVATPPAFSINNRIFFVCFHLPVVVVQNPTTMEWQASWSESILARSEGSQILSTYQGHWVGTVTTLPPLQNDTDREIVRNILEQMKCIPIFLDPMVRQSHYYGFCKQVLWPAFHNIDLLDMSTCGWLSDPTSVASDWDQGRLEDWWHAYIAVNEEFSMKMTNMLRAGDIVWIHDYHLSLLPHKLADWEMSKFGKKVTRKVFFLHIPFPTSQIFRELECGETILKGMLHADVVGFHAFDHARHFLNAAKRILGLNYESLVGGLIGVNFEGSTVLVSMSNVSIEPRMVDAALMLPSVQMGRDEIKRKHTGRTIISGVDIGQRLSGASLKLLAYERLLQDYPSWQPHVVMVQRILIPGTRRADEELTTLELRALVKRIQDKFGTAVIDYQEVIGSSLPMDQRLALWRASDILMSTAIREGLNHWPMEFIYAHKEPEPPGIVITSEFSAVSSILNGALRVNPYDIQATITMIDRALSMDQQEREGRRYRDIFFVSNSPSDKWVKNVLRDLRDATSATSASSGGDSVSQISTPYATPNPVGNLSVDSTAAFLAREASLAFKHLHLRDLKRAYDATKRRVIILDFNGTIVLKEPPGKYLKREILGTSGNKPPPEVVEALTRLCADQRNTVFVVSGDSAENVLTAIGHIPRLGLAVSNGACFSPPLDNPSMERRRWLNFDLGVDWDAVKKVALPVLSKYTARSNGSFVKLTKFSIGWSYYSCDPEWGSLQAMYLVMELENELRSFDVRFVTLKGIVEVVPRKLNKGLIVKKVLQDTTMRSDAEGDGVDFILCCGDDISDEKMFSSVYNFLSELGDEHAHQYGTGVPPVFEDQPAGRRTVSSSQMDTLMDTTTNTSITKVPDPIYAFTVAVGKKETHACTYVNDAQEVANALVMLPSGTVPSGGVQVWGRTEPSTKFA